MKPTTVRRFVALSTCLAALSPMTSAEATVEPREPDATTRCPVCGMRVAPHAEWLAQIVFVDGSAVFFDGGKDFFKYLRARDGHAPGEPGNPVAATFVTSYYDLEVIPAESAFFVAGSEVVGPMGKELVAHPTLAAAEEFRRDHGGSGIFRFDQVTAEVLQTLEIAGSPTSRTGGTDPPGTPRGVRWDSETNEEEHAR